MKTVLRFTILSLLATNAFGHARFKLNAAFKARTTDTGLKAAPCGGAARTTNPTILKAGQTVTIEWEETIQHPGMYRISFAPDADTGFEANILADNIVDNQDDGATIPHSFSTTITVPATPCDNCTLQMIQVMTDRVPPVNYYSCADIQIKAADDATVTAPSAPTGLTVEMK
jgi:hypothetical protein